MTARLSNQRRRAKPRGQLEPWEGVRARLLARPDVRFHYSALKIREEIGEALTRARTAAGLTQAQVAERAGTTQPVIARLEKGRGGVPSLDLLNRVAGAMGLRLALSLRAGRAA